MRIFPIFSFLVTALIPIYLLFNYIDINLDIEKTSRINLKTVVNELVYSKNYEFVINNNLAQYSC
jgi:hypothetical protein